MLSKISEFKIKFNLEKFLEKFFKVWQFIIVN